MKSKIREYLNFTRKERLGILILVVIILLVAVAPAFFEPSEISEDSTALAGLRAGIVMLEQARQDQKDSFQRRNAYYTKAYPRDEEADGKYSPENYSVASGTARPHERGGNAGINNVEVSMFYFDPNKLDPAGWKKLGIREKTITTITKYLSKGGKFRKAEDLMKIYGLSEVDKNRLLPFIRISGLSVIPFQPGQTSTAETNDQTTAVREWPKAVREWPKAVREWPKSTYSKKLLHDIDINKADTSEWKSLPGIGSALSSRIVKYRERLGGFHNSAQVAEVYGLQDSVFQSLRAYLKCSPSQAKIRLNDVTPEVLEQHPYLRRQIARAIIDYRSQHGPYRRLEDLKQLVAITPELFEKIAPYLAL